VPGVFLRLSLSLYIHVTIHRKWFILNNQPDALVIQMYSVIKLYMFRASSLPIIRSFLLHVRHWYISCRFMMTASKQSQDGTAVPSWLCLEASGWLFKRNISKPLFRNQGYEQRRQELREISWNKWIHILKYRSNFHISS